MREGKGRESVGGEGEGDTIVWCLVNVCLPSFGVCAAVRLMSTQPK